MFFSPLACAFFLLAGATAQETTEGFVTIQTSIPDDLSMTPQPTSEVTSIPQLTFCSGRGVYTDACESADMSIPAGETPITISDSATITSGSTVAVTPTESSSGGSSPSETQSTSSSGAAAPAESTPGAASSLFKGDGGAYGWFAALSGLSVSFGFAWTLL